MFAVYLRLGFEHLLDLQGYDHILFLAGLCAAYTLTRWRELLILVTAFTVGHSLSLALATLRLVEVNTSLVEFLIPVTIVATAAINLVGARRREAAAGPTAPGPAAPADGPPAPASPAGAAAAPPTARRARYAAALVFGIVHGLGFSNFLRVALGDERNILVPLLSFNVGLELAQIAVAGAITVAALLVTRLLPVSERMWNVGVSLATGAVAAAMAAQRWPW